MLFNSWQFALFFPIVTLSYFLLPKKLRPIQLLLASAIFYMAFIPSYILILVILIVVDYFAAKLIESSRGKKRKLYLVISLITNIGFLGYFKYTNFLEGNISQFLNLFGIFYKSQPLGFVLPLGLSFHTFQSMSYTIEVYKKRVRAERSILYYALYVMFYPQLVAGPIERPYNLLPQLHKTNIFDSTRVSEGLRVMLWGFFKKLVIADRIAVLIGPIFNAPGAYSGLTLLVATYLFAIQIYCDFSAYSSIALGAAKVMGYNIMNNFNNPYFAQSVSDFWDRWHISLSTWFRDYLYVPLGGSKVSWWKSSGIILIVFLTSGLWHGADWKFVVWGFIHGLYLVSGRILNLILIKFRPAILLAEPLFAIPKFVTTSLKIFITFNLVSFAWIFFRANSIKDAFMIISSIAQILAAPLAEIKFAYGFSYLPLLGLIIFMFFVEVINFMKVSKLPTTLRWSVYYCLLYIIMFAGQFSEIKFIYFQF